MVGAALAAPVLAPVLALVLVLSGAAPLRAQELFAEAQESCAACHGEAAEGEVPHLGGLDAFYALVQLVAFREGDRESEVMQGMVADFSDDDLRAAADWVAGLPPPEVPADAPDADVAEAGAALVAEHRCASCHGADLRGGRQIPYLRNQRHDYLLKALGDYRAERRIGDRAAMVEVAQALSEPDLETLAAFLSGMGE